MVVEPGAGRGGSFPLAPTSRSISMSISVSSLACPAAEASLTVGASTVVGSRRISDTVERVRCKADDSVVPGFVEVASSEAPVLGGAAVAAAGGVAGGV